MAIWMRLSTLVRGGRWTRAQVQISRPTDKGHLQNRESRCYSIAISLNLITGLGFNTTIKGLAGFKFSNCLDPCAGE